MPALSQIVPPQASALASDAARWWLGELRSMLPVALTASRTKPRCDILVCKSATVVDRIKAGLGERLLDERPLEGLDQEGWAELAGLAAGAQTRLILAPPDVYVTRLELPAAARSRVRSAVSLQLGHLAPIEPSLLTWNSEIISADKSKVSVVVAMARTRRIEQLLSLLAENGLEAPKVVAMAEGRPVTLFAAPVRITADRRSWLIASGLLASIPLTTLAGGALLSGIEENRIAALQREIAPLEQAERQAARAEKMRRALKPLVETPAATKAIEALAAALPETAFVREAALAADGGLSFTVETTDADALAKSLLEAPLFASATLVDMAPTEEGKVRVNYRASIR